MRERLPGIVEELAAKFPGIWDAYNLLGEAAGDGPLSPREVRLVKLALAVGAQKQGAVHSHARRALNAGISIDELEQVALLGITTIGWPSAVAAYSWVRDQAPGASRPKAIGSPGKEQRKRGGQVIKIARSRR